MAAVFARLCRDQCLPRDSHIAQSKLRRQLPGSDPVFQGELDDLYDIAGGRAPGRHRARSPASASTPSRAGACPAAQRICDAPRPSAQTRAGAAPMARDRRAVGDMSPTHFDLDVQRFDVPGRCQSGRLPRSYRATPALLSGDERHNLRWSVTRTTRQLWVSPPLAREPTASVGHHHQARGRQG